MRTLLLAVGGVLACGRLATAQKICPGGGLPPCPAAPVARAPALDPNTWLVLPFANRTAHPDSILLRQGTAALLRFEFERWPELKVVDDAAVALQLRRMGLEGRPVTVAQARTVARAFGAGNVVLGEVIPGPHSVRVVARSYSTGSGQREREGSAVTTLAESTFTSAMGSVAARLLNLAQVPGATGSAAGTQSLAAYREYVQGRLRLRQGDGDSALKCFRRAIALDSTFALARYAGLVTMLGSYRMRTEGRVLALAALRHSAALAPYERRKIAAAEALSRPAEHEACRLHTELLASDTTDYDVLLGLGFSCDNTPVLADARSPSGYAFVPSLQRQLWAWQRVLEADSTNAEAYWFVWTLLIRNSWQYGCRGEETMAQCPRDRVMWAPVSLDHDTLFAIPWPLDRYGGGPLGDTTSPETHLRATRLKAEMARTVVERWRSYFPESRRPRNAYAMVAQALGQPEIALPVVRDFASPETTGLPTQVERAVQILLQLNRPREAVALYDSLQRANAAALARGDSSLVQVSARDTSVGLLLGYVSPKFGARGRWYGYGPNVTDLIRRELGLGPDSLLPFEADSGRRSYRFLPELRGPDGRPNAKGDSALAADRLYYSVQGFHDRRTLLVADTLARPQRDDWLHLFQVRLTSGDTAGARELVRRWDSHLYLGATSYPWLGTWHVYVAESYLELGDSATALERLRDYARKFPHSPLYTPPTDVPRVWIRYGDLAYALHQREDAIRAYRFIAELWDHADPVFQPTVQRARTRLAELTGGTM
jgi:tetratricopeptide (TPR) repeat protein/TolB-like protein